MSINREQILQNGVLLTVHARRGPERARAIGREIRLLPGINTLDVHLKILHARRSKLLSIFHLALYFLYASNDCSTRMTASIGDLTGDIYVLVISIGR